MQLFCAIGINTYKTKKIQSLASYIGTGKDIADHPGNAEMYEKTAQQIETYIEKLIEKLKGSQYNENSLDSDHAAYELKESIKKC